MRDEMMTLRGEIVAVDDEIVAPYNGTILPRAAVFPSRERKDGFFKGWLRRPQSAFGRRSHALKNLAFGIFGGAEARTALTSCSIVSEPSRFRGSISSTSVSRSDRSSLGTRISSFPLGEVRQGSTGSVPLPPRLGRCRRR